MKTITEYNIVRLKAAKGIGYHKERVPDWTPEHVCSLVDLKDWRYFWFEKVKTTRTLEAGILTFRSEVLETSSKFFVNAYVETYEDVKVTNQELAERMTDLNWHHIARSIDVENYWTECFEDGKDILIEI